MAYSPGMNERFVVVGGDAAGMSAASKAKRDDPNLDVVVLERTDWVSYGACGLPYYVKGEIADVDDLIVKHPKRLVEELGIDLRRGHEVVSVDATDRTVTVEVVGEWADGDLELGDRYDLAYDDLLLATGGTPTELDVPGMALPGVFTLRSVAAGEALRNYLLPDGHPASSVVEGEPAPALREYVNRTDPGCVAVVGGNKIGLELAEAFAARGAEVHVFERRPEILPLFGPAGQTVADHLEERGVVVHRNCEVESLHGTDDRVSAVVTPDRGVYVDLVVVDVGVDPNVDLAVAAGIELGATGAVATDAYGRTSAPGVYAAGDCAEKHHLLTGEAVQWPFALAANRAGRAIGRTVAGRETPVGPIVGTLVMKAIDVQAARTGLLVDEARAAGYEPVATTITTISRAHYCPGWGRIGVHLVADRPTGRVLGCAMVGPEGVAHRINSVATALHAGMTVTELGDLDFGYAPPFGPAWDPVLTAAKVLGDELEVEPAGRALDPVGE